MSAAMAENVILCRLVWAPFYKSKDENKLMFAGRMRYPRENKQAHEVLNFAEEGGFVYGFVENRGQSINLANLGGKKTSSSIDGVKVVFCSVDEETMRLRVVGWYDDARVFSEPQTLKRASARGSWQYYFKAKIANAHLIPETERELLVPTKETVTDRGFIGQRCVFYPSRSVHYRRFLETVALLSTEIRLPKPSGSTPEFQEGQRMSREIMVSARNSKLVQKAKAHHGTTCQACGFNFGKFYGARGEGFIEVHHKIKLAGNGERATTVHDVDVLCANCHRVVHRTADPLTLAELKESIASAGKG